MQILKVSKVFLIIFICIPWTYTHSSRPRHIYGGKVLNISPKACTSSEFPGIVGTCMISLECQQRSGTVIGACRDGHLFGACCSDAAAELPTAEPLKDASSTTLLATPLPPLPNKDHLHQSFKIPQSLLDLAIFSIASDKQDHKEGESDDPNNESAITGNPIVEISTMTMSGHNNNLRNVTPAIVPTQGTTPFPTTTTIATTTQARLVYTTTTTIPTTTAPTIRTTTSAVTTSHAHPISQETFTEKTTTPRKASTDPTTKFTYGKIKYSPRPVKLRSTTEKMVWTRPPTTEASYSIFTSSTEDEDDEEIGNEISKRAPQPKTVSTIMLSTGSGSVETSTLPVQQPPLSNEEVAATTLVAPTISEPSLTTLRDVTAKPIDTPITTEKVVVKKAGSTSTTKPPPNFASSPKTNSTKQSRLSNEIDDDDSESSSSAGWDNKINEFVNQVVAGIATELDKSNIDDVVFKPPPSTRKTTTTTTTTPSLKKKDKKTSMKSKHSSKSKNSTSNKKKNAASTTKRTPTKNKTKKPSKKKVSTPSESVEIERDVLDYREVCGVRPLARHSRIVGGNPSIHGNWPWMALVKETVWWGIFSKIKCGGVLIGPQHVLTAGHCQPQQTGTLSVVLGVTDSDHPSSHAVTKVVRRVIRHPQFNQRSYENDIAILELDTPVQFQPHIVPICLPDIKENFVGKKGFVTGMGLLKHDGERPSMLYEVDVPILNNTDCQKMFRKSGNMKPIKPSFICAGYRRGRKDSCGGDSGGPLSVKRNNGQWVLAGTVSHGIKCAIANQPGIYMRATWYLPWIEKVLRSARSDLPKCHGPPPVCERPQARSGGLMDTLFRIFRIARRLWKTRK